MPKTRCLARWRRSPSERVWSMVRFFVAEPRKSFSPAGFVAMPRSLGKSARKKASCRWIRLQSEP